MRVTRTVVTLRWQHYGHQEFAHLSLKSQPVFEQGSLSLYISFSSVQEIYNETELVKHLWDPTLKREILVIIVSISDCWKGFAGAKPFSSLKMILKNKNRN